MRALRTPLAAALAAVAFAGTARGDRGFVIVTNRDNPAASVTKTFLEDVFLKRVTVWPDGEEVHPVDLSSRAPARQAFCAQILGRTVEDVRLYWEQRIFSGRDVPPAELDTDAEVIAFVARHPGAIGYVSAEAPLDDVKVLPVH